MSESHVALKCLAASRACTVKLHADCPFHRVTMMLLYHVQGLKACSIKFQQTILVDYNGKGGWHGTKCKRLALPKGLTLGIFASPMSLILSFGILFSCRSLFTPGHFPPANKEAAVTGDVALTGTKSSSVYACSVISALTALPLTLAHFPLWVRCRTLMLTPACAGLQG